MPTLENKVTLTVKEVERRVHIGSSPSTIRKVTRLSRAAGKFNALAGTKVKAEQVNLQNQTDAVLTEMNSTVKKVLTYEFTVEEASIFATEVFNRISDKGEHTAAYDKRKAQFDTAKAGVLAQMNAKTTDELTSEQKRDYARRMLENKAPFDCRESSIHIKISGQKTVCSNTVRGIQPLNLSAICEAVAGSLDKLRTKWHVTLTDSAIDADASITSEADLPEEEEPTMFGDNSSE